MGRMTAGVRCASVSAGQVPFQHKSISLRHVATCGLTSALPENCWCGCSSPRSSIWRAHHVEYYGHEQTNSSWRRSCSGARSDTIIAAPVTDAGAVAIARYGECQNRKSGFTRKHCGRSPQSLSKDSTPELLWRRCCGHRRCGCGRRRGVWRCQSRL